MIRQMYCYFCPKRSANHYLNLLAAVKSPCSIIRKIRTAKTQSDDLGIEKRERKDRLCGKVLQTGTDIIDAQLSPSC